MFAHPHGGCSLPLMLSSSPLSSAVCVGSIACHRLSSCVAPGTYTVRCAGVLESLVAFIPFFLTFSHFGIGISELRETASTYWKIGAPDFQSGNNTYNESTQLNILAQAQSIYFAMVVSCQWFHVWACKTRGLPIWEHELFGNITMIYGLLFEAALLMLIVYFPYTQSFFGSADPQPASLWAFALMGMAVFFLINEPRKWVIRHYPKSGFTKVFAW